MAKGTKQIRIGRVEQLKKKFDLAQHVSDQFDQSNPLEDKYDYNAGHRVGMKAGLEWAMKMLFEEFPELQDEGNQIDFSEKIKAAQAAE